MSLLHLLGLARKGVKLSTGERIEIKPLTIKQALVVERVFGPLAGDLAERGLNDAAAYVVHAEALCELVSVACNKPLAWVEKLSRADFQALMTKLLEVEADFLAALIAQAGQTRALQKARQTGPRSSKP